MKESSLGIQMKKGIMDLCVLALLSRQDCYGYELAETLAGTTNSSEGTIYPILRKMKDAGLLTTYVSEVSGGPPRKYYAITPIGRDTLARECQNWLRLSAAVNGILKELRT